MTEDTPIERDGPFPTVDPVEHAPEASVLAQEVASAADFAEVEIRAAVHYEDVLNGLGTARAALSEILALSSSPSVSTGRLGAIAQKALEALPVT